MTDSDPCSTKVQQVALSLIPGLGGRTLDNLLAHFGSLEAILHATAADLRAVPRIGPKLTAAIQAIDLDQTRAAIIAWQAAGITLALKGENGYPPALTGLDDAPPVLFIRGSLLPGDDRAVALVGTRQPSSHARQLANRVANELAARQWTIVSGLAAGIDTAAHTGALPGRTLAVLGSGVQNIYPPENEPLAGQIIEHGALLAEVHPDISPHSSALVARNRLISGLSVAVIVIEAGETSGSLHAARFASTQGRAVFVVECAAAGSRKLIAEGAHVLPTDYDQLTAELEALLS